MIPRDYQKAAVAAARDRLATHGNTLLVLPTGAGKTAIAGFCIGEELEHRRQDRDLVLQHTDELVDQNRSSIGAITGLLLILVERNPTVLAALFRPSPAVEANFSLRVKLVESSAVYAVAITTDGQACFARKTIQVTQGACGA